MEFIDLKIQQARIRDKIETNIRTVLDHGKYIMGPEVGELEEKLADYVGVKHCIGVSSGTDALLIAMMALDIGPGDEVITTPFTFIATSEMIALLGAKPVFVDIDPKTYNIDPSKIEDVISQKTKAILPVSLYGQCADMDAIDAIATRYALPVIEDGAQSFGATYKGRQSCGLSIIGCTSFFPSKPFGGYGDGGACFTDDAEIAKAMREIRVHGQNRRYHHPRIGLNGRLDTLQAAILLAKFEIFSEEVELRGQVGDRYTKIIQRNCTNIIPPYIASDNTSVYSQYTVLVNNRKEVQNKLKMENIPTAIHYPVPLNRQPAFQTDYFDTAVADALSDKVLSLPMHPYLNATDQQRIVAVLSELKQVKNEVNLIR
jgi:UDP-2-acetamido-2-deoxy-ribo-hexuluronate aminotransferase